jgi:spore coat polysaccharide biosynthesis predicted glycosyltransferase SpsG
MVDLVVDNVPMRTVLDDTDLFISIYSQTLFEASCLGIPVIYHKNDREIMDPPFDGKSELLTTFDVSDLEQALQDFLMASHRFDAFLEKSVMEKYIGPLDGKNLERNFDYVIGLLEHSLPCSGESGSEKRI